VPLLTRYEAWALFVLFILAISVADFCHSWSAVLPVAALGSIALVIVALVTGSTPDRQSVARPAHPHHVITRPVTTPVDSDPVKLIRAFGYWFSLDGNTASVFRINNQGHLSAEFDRVRGPAEDLVQCGGSLYLTHGVGEVARLDPNSGDIRANYHYADDASGDALGNLACGGGHLWVSDPDRGQIFELTLGLHYVHGWTLVEHAQAIAFGGGTIWIVDSHMNELVGIQISRLWRVGPYALGPGATQILFAAHYLWVLHAADSCVRRFDFAQGSELDQGTPTGHQPTSMSYSDGRIVVSDSAQGAVFDIDTISGRLESSPIVVGGGHTRLVGASQFDGRTVVIDAVSGQSVFLSPAASVARRAKRSYLDRDACR
jgi:hypothetical protein